MSDRGVKPEENWENSPSATGTNHVLAIGIDAYQYWQSLNNAVRDCDALIEVLTRKYRFDEKQVVRLYNAEATRDKIWITLEKLVAKVTPEDNVLIYYAGHGYQDEKKWGYWIPVNASKSSRAGFFKDREVMDFIKEIHCHHLMLISDSCFSGTFFKALSRSKDSFSRDPSRWALTSGRLEAVSDGKMGEGSPFNRLLVEALEENSDKLHFSKLAQQVKFGTNEVTGKKQSPLTGPLDIEKNEGGEFVFLPKKDEEVDWRRTIEQGTIDALHRYLMHYPNGKYVAKAHKHLDDLAWQAAMMATSLVAFRKYLKDHPKGEFALDAYAQIDKLEWQAAKQKDTKDSYRHYLNTVSFGKYRQEAIKAMDFCEDRSVFNRAKHRESRLRQYLLDVEQGKYDGHFEEEARRLLAEMENETMPKPDLKPQKKSVQSPRENLKPKEVPQENDKNPKSIPKAVLESSEKTNKGTSIDPLSKQLDGTQHKIKPKPKPKPQRGLWISVGLGLSLLMIWGILQINQSPKVIRSLPNLNKYDSLISMKPIKGGEFIMGSDEGKKNEGPSHMVAVESFEIGEAEITNEQFVNFWNSRGYLFLDREKWDSYLPYENKDKGKCGIFFDDETRMFLVENGCEDYPAVYISYYEAKAFAAWLNINSSYIYRLPTEAEWEYAASGGSKGYNLQGKRIVVWAGGYSKIQLRRYAWYGNNSRWKVQATRQKKPNPIGLYDMSGNVSEWVLDWYNVDYYNKCAELGIVMNPKDTNSVGGYKIHRGGSVKVQAEECSVYSRQYSLPNQRDGYIGFRIVRHSVRDSISEKELSKILTDQTGMWHMILSSEQYSLDKANELVSRFDKMGFNSVRLVRPNKTSKFCYVSFFSNKDRRQCEDFFNDVLVRDFPWNLSIIQVE